MAGGPDRAALGYSRMDSSLSPRLDRGGGCCHRGRRGMAARTCRRRLKMKRLRRSRMGPNQTDWVGDLCGGLGFGPTTGCGSCSAESGRAGSGVLKPGGPRRITNGGRYDAVRVARAQQLGSGQTCAPARVIAERATGREVFKVAATTVLGAPRCPVRECPGRHPNTPATPLPHPAAQTQQT